MRRSNFMKAGFSRRKMIKALGTTALLTPLTYGDGVRALRGEGRDTPKICLEMGEGRLSAGSPDEAGTRRVRQLGVDNVLMAGPPIPWREDQVRAIMDRL